MHPYIVKSSERDIQNGNKIAIYKRDQGETQGNKVSKKIKITLIFIIVFLAICIIGAVSLFIYLKKNKEENNDDNKGENKDDNNQKSGNTSIGSQITKEGRCEIGSGEKCLTCDYSKGECATCNTGYFLPEDEATKTKCRKCSIKNCEKCSGNKISDTCSSCEGYSSPVYQNSKIQKCIVEIGEGPKCLTSDLEKNECKSCNLGYKYENGQCIVNHHFKATFITTKNNEKIKLAQQLFPFIQEMIVDGIILDSPVKEYTFSVKGEHTIYYKIKILNNLSMIGMFEGLKKMTSISFTKLFNIKNNQKMDRMFYNCQKLKSIDFSNINTDNMISMNNMLYQCLSLTSFDFSKINTSLLKDASYMFDNCISLVSIDFSNFKSQNLELIDGMFQGCNSLTDLNLNTFITNKVEDMSYLFKDCSSLTSIVLSSFNTEQVQDVTKMFSGCSSLTSIDISKFYLPKVETLDYMFMDCTNLQYINMALLNNRLLGTFENIHSFGTIITNNNAKSEISNALPGWNINTR